jgi:hypothetical protein
VIRSPFETELAWIIQGPLPIIPALHPLVWHSSTAESAAFFVLNFLIFMALICRHCRLIASVYFRHCRFIFGGYCFGMTFSQSLADFTAAQIIKALGCPRGTAYDWKDGRREPPMWQQRHWLSLIQHSIKKA